MMPGPDTPSPGEFIDGDTINVRDAMTAALKRIDPAAAGRAAPTRGGR